MSYNATRSSSKNNIFRIPALSISIPIFTGNSLLMQQQQAEISIDQAEYGYITLLNDLRVQAELIRESLENY